MLCSLQNFILVECLVSLIYEVPDLFMLPRFEIPFESLRRNAISPLSHSGALTAFAKSFFWCRPKGVEGSEELKAVANHWHNLLPSKKHQKSLPILTNWHKSSCKPSAAKLASIKKYQKASQIFPKLEWTIGIQGFTH